MSLRRITGVVSLRVELVIVSATVFGLAARIGGLGGVLASFSFRPRVREIPIATGPGNQMFPRMVSDGAGGAVITWFDTRNGDADIFAQWVAAGGRILWPQNGLPVCEALGDQLYPKILRDGTEVMIAWEDERCGNPSKDVFIHRVRLDTVGAREWAKDGLPLMGVCYPGNQRYPQIVSDGAGGAILTWADDRNDDLDVYSQRIDANGSIVWAADGVPVVRFPSEQSEPQVASDGAGGAFIIWEDFRDGLGSVYFQHLDSNGSPLCEPNGVPLVEHTLASAVRIKAFADGTCIAIWHDGRHDEGDVYAQKMATRCSSLWKETGVPIVTAPGDQTWFRIVGDGTGGAIIVWWDGREGNDDIYAQRISPGGKVLWAASGIPICTGESPATNRPEWQIIRPQIASDIAGDPIIVWWDRRTGDDDVYAQRISAQGARLWPSNGIPVGRAAGPQRYPQVVSDGAGGAIVVWEDERNGDVDLYGAIISASAIPAVSQWGLILMGLTMLAAGTVVIWWRRKTRLA